MDKWDRDNLDFLLSIDDKTFQDFLEQSDDDDIDYAIELIQKHKAEIMIRELELADALPEDNAEEFAEARAVLARFRL